MLTFVRVLSAQDAAPPVASRMVSAVSTIRSVASVQYALSGPMSPAEEVIFEAADSKFLNAVNSING